jgi:hypothetical protein
MRNLFQEIRILKEEGKLHAKLISRVRMLFIISLILAAVVLFNVIFRNIPPYFILGIIALTIVGFFLGLRVFSKMSVVDWNEEEEILKVGKMDKIGYISLALYICFEVGLRTLLKSNFPLYMLPLLLSGIFGTIFGRAVGTLVEIHKVYTENHA